MATNNKGKLKKIVDINDPYDTYVRRTKTSNELKVSILIFHNFSLLKLTQYLKKFIFSLFGYSF